MSMPFLTRKVDINLGYGCNCACPFCYYYDSVISKTDLNTVTTDEAKQQLLRAKRLGMLEIEFTGGEVTLRSDLKDLVAFSKQELGFRIVSLVTNGTVLSNKRYAETLAAAGLDDILFSLHGHTEEVHDLLVAKAGSFLKLVTAIDNAHEMGLRIRTNTVICQQNYRSIADIIRLCLEKHVDNINLIMFNPIIQRANVGVEQSLYVSHTEAARNMIEAFEANRNRLPHVNVRYLPFCLLPGYEAFVTNHDQFNFEPDEWNNYVATCIRDGWPRALKRALIGLRDVRYKSFAFKYGLRGLLMAGMGRYYTLLQKVKLPQCNSCACRNICDYVWKGYFDVFGDGEFSPIPGPIIANPVWVTNAARIRKPGELPTNPI